MIEQPLADDGMSLVNHADLQQRIGTPVCLDESAQSLAHVQAAIRLKSCRVVNIKMARVGGLTESREIQALCAQHDIPCWVGGMLESAIGGAICAELATLPNFTYAGDIFPSSYFYTNDLGKPEIVLSGRGEVATSRVPGIAQAPDPELLEALDRRARGVSPRFDPVRTPGFRPARARAGCIVTTFAEPPAWHLDCYS